VLGVFQARHSHVEAKECYGSRIIKDDLIGGNDGPSGADGRDDTHMCLLMSQMSRRIYTGVQRVRGGFGVKPTRFGLQGWSHLDETRLAKGAITDII
jgi:hypothetical protein